MVVSLGRTIAIGLTLAVMLLGGSLVLLFVLACVEAGLAA